MPLGHAWCNVKCIVRSVVDDLVPLTVRAHFLDDRSSSTALVACNLALREHAREYLGRRMECDDPGKLCVL